MTHLNDTELEALAAEAERRASALSSMQADGTRVDRDPFFAEVAATLRACNGRGVGVKPLDELEAGDFAHLVVPALFRPCAHGGGWWETTDADGRNVLLGIETPALTDTPDTDTQADRLAELEAERDAARAEVARLRDALERIDEASNHYAMTSTYSEGTLRYAHQSTRNLARAAMQEGGE